MVQITLPVSTMDAQQLLPVLRRQYVTKKYCSAQFGFILSIDSVVDYKGTISPYSGMLLARVRVEANTFLPKIGDQFQCTIIQILSTEQRMIVVAFQFFQIIVPFLMGTYKIGDMIECRITAVRFQRGRYVATGQVVE